MPYVSYLPLKTRPPRIGAYLVMFALPTIFRTTTFKSTYSNKTHSNLGSPNRAQRSFQSIGDQVPLQSPYQMVICNMEFSN